MRRLPRKLLAWMALAAGLAILGFEFQRGQWTGEIWFWAVIAALTVLFALVEIFSSPPPAK